MLNDDRQQYIVSNNDNDKELVNTNNYIVILNMKSRIG